MPIKLARALNEAALRRIAGERSYQRGRKYYAGGHVELLDSDTESVRATALETHDYLVTFSCSGYGFDYSCDCPQGVDGAFCKHCVAAGLAWLNRNSAATKAKTRRKTIEPTLAEAENVLLAEDQEIVVRMVIGWAKDDSKLHERLLQLAARRMPRKRGRRGLEEYRTLERHAKNAGSWTEWREQALSESRVRIAADRDLPPGGR